MESTTPLFPCKSLAVTLDFYRALGFEVTYEQTEPYLYGAVRFGKTDLHFAKLRVYGAHGAFGAGLVFVPAIAPYHRAFADGLRAKYGKVPTAGTPRITRLRKGHTRFKLFDPTGNLLIYINNNEPEAEYGGHDKQMSDLARALDNAIFLRDIYANDKAAARALDVALQRFATANATERALALAARAELAVAMGDTECAQAAQLELQQLSLSAGERERIQDELRAADELAMWITGEKPA